MAQECGFFNAQLVGEEYDRVYLAEQFAAYFASFIGNGVFGQSMQKMEVLAQTTPNMSVKVLSGEAWINGWWYRNTEEYTLSLDIADGVLSRIDAIVLRWGNQERDMWLQVIKGEASANPTAPAIKRDADYYDLQLATISVARGAINITQSSIQDTRLNNAVCGLVTGVVDQIDTTDLYNQFESYFAEFKANQEADYNTWTAEQKQAYLDYIADTEAAYDNWVSSKQNDYNAWTTDKMAEYAQFVSKSEQDYKDFIDKYEQDYNKFIDESEKNYSQYITDKKNAYDIFILQTESDYNQWVALQKANYDKWISDQESEYEDWYNTHTTEWTNEFTEWFEDIQDKLSGDVAAKQQQQLDAHEERLTRLEHMVFTGVLEAPLVTDDGYIIGTSDGDAIEAVWPMCQCTNQ